MPSPAQPSQVWRSFERVRDGGCRWERGVAEPSGEGWPLPFEWCPNRGATVCLRVKGNSTSPLILHGYIIAADTSEIKSENLAGQIVVAAHKEKGLLVSRLIRFGPTDALVSDHREYESVPVRSGSEWRIVGKVLWWTGRAR